MSVGEKRQQLGVLLLLLTLHREEASTCCCSAASRVGGACVCSASCDFHAAADTADQPIANPGSDS